MQILKTVRLWVHDHLQKGGPTYFYRVELTVPAASTGTDIPRVDGNNVANQDRQWVAVPKGNRFAFLALANRADWGGPAAVGFDKLPAGATFAADPVDPGLNLVPVVFEAKPDAPVGGVLADLQVKPADPKVAEIAWRRPEGIDFAAALPNVRDFVEWWWARDRP